MPYVHLQTNAELDKGAAVTFAQKLSAFAARAVGKPEQYVQTVVSPGLAMAHGGDTGPTAFVDLKSIGLAENKCPALSQAVCDFLEKELGIPPSRVYIQFTDLAGARFGWNGSTF